MHCIKKQTASSGVSRPAASLLRFGTLLICFLAGCGNDERAHNAQVDAENRTVADSSGADLKSKGTSKSSTPEPETYGQVEFKPLSLSNVPRLTTIDSDASADGDVDTEKQIQSIIAGLQPLQILLGQWRGTTRREFENFKAVDNHEWVWDLRTDPIRPALTINSDKSPYLKTGRLTWDVATEKYSLEATDVSGRTRKYAGGFSEPVHEIVGSDDKLHKVFRLEFDQVELSDGEDGELWQLAIDQQENNRYLLEIGKRRGSAAYARYDTVSTQREGTSFALSDADYGEKTCIISEGLGTTELTFKGRSYWVCCSGCKAAFEEDPEKWIARAAIREPKK